MMTSAFLSLGPEGMKLELPPDDEEQPKRDWPEDFPHENGNYWGNCMICGKKFTGHKRRVQCKVCAGISHHVKN